MTKVQVLLSTFNGEKYLEKQIESLISQKDLDINIFIRDDGSSDNTINILSALADRYSNQINISFGSNVGVVASYFELLRQAPEADFFSFSDQDDVWKTDKLKRAISFLQEVPTNIPAMYCSRTELVDKDLKHIGFWPPKPSRGASFYNALIENIAVGCTIVINREAKNLITRNLPNPQKVIMHDWWFYLCIAAFGQVIYDPYPSLLYRQHDFNVVGGVIESHKKWIKRWRSFRSNHRKYLIRRQAEEFYKIFGGSLPISFKKTIENFLSINDSFLKRFNYIIHTNLYRQNSIDNMLFKLLYLMNKI